MSKRPSFQFYVADWMTDLELRACSLPARGLWIDMLCLMHMAKPYGYLMTAGRPMSNGELGRALGEQKRTIDRLVAELEANGVAFRTPEICNLHADGMQSASELHADGMQSASISHAIGMPEGVLFNRRFLRDEAARNRAKPQNSVGSGDSTGEDRGEDSRARTRAGPRARAPAQSTSTSGSTVPSSANATEGTGGDGSPPRYADFDNPADFFFDRRVIDLVMSGGHSDRAARSFIGKLRQALGNAIAAAKIESCFVEKPNDPAAWLRASVPEGVRAKSFRDTDYGEGGKLGGGDGGE